MKCIAALLTVGMFLSLTLPAEAQTVRPTQSDQNFWTELYNRMGWKPTPGISSIDRDSLQAGYSVCQALQVGNPNYVKYVVEEKFEENGLRSDLADAIFFSARNNLC